MRGLRIALVAVVASITQVALTIAYTSLLFRDQLAPDLGLGIAAMFAGLALAATILAVTSGLGGHLVGPQDTGLIVLASSGPAIAAAAGDAAGETALVLMGLGAIATGATLVVLGRFGLGKLIRYLPFPVVAGFLAGTGIVIGLSSYHLAADGIAGTAAGGADRVARLAVGVALAAALTVAARSSRPTEKILPVLVLGAVATVDIGRWIGGVGRVEGAERGWLLPVLPDGTLITTTPVEVIRDADWAAVADQLPALLPLLVLVPVTLMLYLGVFESSLDVELDVDREFVQIGATNLGVGAVGSGAAFTQFANTMLIQNMAGPRRTIPGAVGLAAVVVLVMGDTVVALVPQPVVAGMLGFIAVTMVLDWMWDLRHRVRPVELGLAAMIAVSIPVFGFLAGVGIGLLLTAGWFILQYSRISGVRRVRDGVVLRSNVVRPADEIEVLAERGAEVLVVELDGFLFFGTGDAILTVVTDLAAGRDVRWLVLDCERVTGADSSAAASFGQIVRWAERCSVTIGWSGLRPPVARSLSALLAEQRAGRRFVDLDRALEWTEAGRLTGFESTGTGAQLLDRVPELRDRGRLVAYAPGEAVLIRGEASPGLLIVDTGVVRVDGGTADVRRSRLGAGSVLGEIGLYRASGAQSTVVAESACDVIVLGHDEVERLLEDDPPAAARLHAWLAGELAERLVRVNDEIDSLHYRPGDPVD